MKQILLSMAAAVLLSHVPCAEAQIIVYTDRSAWETAVGGVYVEEFFADATLNPGVSVVSDAGVVDAVLGVWDDRVAGTDTTTWSFVDPITGFGADWDLAGPGGPGSGIRLLLDGTFIGQEIVQTTAGGFFGVTSTSPFDSVLVEEGTQLGGAETYHMDNMLYSQQESIVPEPATLIVWSLLMGMGVGLTRRRRR